MTTSILVNYHKEYGALAYNYNQTAKEVEATQWAQSKFRHWFFNAFLTPTKKTLEISRLKKHWKYWRRFDIESTLNGKILMLFGRPSKYCYVFQSFFDVQLTSKLPNGYTYTIAHLIKANVFLKNVQRYQMFLLFEMLYKSLGKNHRCIIQSNVKLGS